MSIRSIALAFSFNCKNKSDLGDVAIANDAYESIEFERFASMATVTIVICGGVGVGDDNKTLHGITEVNQSDYVHVPSAFHINRMYSAQRYIVDK